MKLENKLALITGSSSGVGAAIVREFAGEGADVILNYRGDERKIFKNLGEAYYTEAIKADVSKVDELKQMFEHIKEKYGRLDILVNNAAVYPRHDFFQATEESYNKVMDTNLKSVFFASQLAGRLMLEQKSGAIINISSNSGLMPKKDKGIEYALSKAGVVYLTKSLALTLAPYVRVNCIAPGFIDTKMSVYANDSEIKREIEGKIPLGRTNSPGDISKTALFLASDDSKNITGQVFVIDGGYSL
ncbi:MAG: glucose 1-dehydrogenase [Nanoarchaeota archaeon]